MTANGTSVEAGRLRGCDRSRTPMRHAELPDRFGTPVWPLFGMHLATRWEEFRDNLRMPVDAEIKRQHFRRFCSQRKTSHRPGRSTHSIRDSKFPLAETGASATIDLAPTAQFPPDGMLVRRRAPHADRDTQVVSPVPVPRHCPPHPAQCGLTF